MSHHLSSQLAAERQRELRAGGAPRARMDGTGSSRALRLARLAKSKSAAVWRARPTHARRRAERLGC